MAKEGLIYIDEITRKQISEKKSSDITISIPKNELEKYQKMGWELIPSKYKRKERVKRPKAHNDAFEDRVWAILAKMRFKYLNKDNNYKIEYEQGISKRIDVFGLDDETAIVVECKSSPERKKMHYSKSINELIGIKEKIRTKIRNEFGKEIKVAFVFATNNSIISNPDRERLKGENIYHFNQDDFDYFELLTEHLGAAAKYQLFGKLFEGQKVPGLKNRIPAIRGKMNTGKIFYSFCIEPETLLKIGFILHRIETTIDAVAAYQRLVKKKRLTEIGQYVDRGGYFPNSIIINIKTRDGKELKFEKTSKKHDSNTDLGILYLPQCYKNAFIVDGQHRLYGYSRAKKQSKHLLPIIAFCNLPHQEQSKIFVDINHKQTSVPASLLRSIMAEFNWDSEDQSLALSSLKTRVITDMNYDERSPLYKRVILSEEKKTETRCLTLQTLANWGFKRAELFGKAKGPDLVKTGYLYDGTYEKTLAKSISFLNGCLEKFENDLEVQWNIGSGEGGFIAMNNGISAIFLVVSDILDFLVKNKDIKPDEHDGEDLVKLVLPYLEPIVKFIEKLDSEGLKKLRSYFGGGAPEKILKEFQCAINAQYADFNPPGLQQWIKEHTGQYITKCFDTGTHIEEELLNKFIKKVLQKEYGTKWWKEGVPINIQKSCSNKKIEKKSDEDVANFLELLDYQEIVSRNWNLLGNYFTPPGLETSGKDKRLAWFVKFNSIRAKYSHPARENTTEEEYNFLLGTKKWLEKKLT
ncbi:MAG: DGQHR domain-containing protein [Candidatus Hodarchaeales archaeon]